MACCARRPGFPAFGAIDSNLYFRHVASNRADRCLLCRSAVAAAALDRRLAKDTGSDDSDQSAHRDQEARRARDARAVAQLLETTLRDGTVYITTTGGGASPIRRRRRRKTVENLKLPDGADGIAINNRFAAPPSAADFPASGLLSAGAQRSTAAAAARRCKQDCRDRANTADPTKRWPRKKTAIRCEVARADGVATLELTSPDPRSGAALPSATQSSPNADR